MSFLARRLLLLALVITSLLAAWAAWTAPTGYPAPEAPAPLPRPARPQ